MTDQKPPRIAVDERATLLALLNYQRQSFIRKVSGVTDEQAAASPVPSGTSLLWLANHMADAETTWVLRRFLQRPSEAPDQDHAATVPEAVSRYRRVCEEVDQLVERERDLDAVCPDFDGGPTVNLRWILGHLLEETARHAGHADVLRELVDGSVGR